VAGGLIGWGFGFEGAPCKKTLFYLIFIAAILILGAMI